MMSLTFGLFTQVSDSGPQGRLVSNLIAEEDQIINAQLLEHQCIKCMKMNELMNQLSL